MNTLSDSPDSTDSTEALDALTALNPTDVRLAAMNLLARREHSRRELRQKLLKRFSDAAVVEAQIDQLTLENLQSDERFAQSYVRMRAMRGYGPARIRQELRERGLRDDEIAEAFRSMEESWFDLALSAFVKKFGEQLESDIKARSRRDRFMQYRGFTREHIDHCEESLSDA